MKPAVEGDALHYEARLHEGVSPSARGPRRILSLLRHALAYEMRKAMAFRLGFFVREVLSGLAKPVVMVLVFQAIFRAQERTELGGYDERSLIEYMLLAAVFGKFLFRWRGIDLSDQIFEGRVTKFLVMPFPMFVLGVGKFLQHLAVQAAVAGALWVGGALLAPEIWPRPVSPGAALAAMVLVILGSTCFFLTYWILHSLAFWLDVVWATLLMSHFLMNFAAGILIPVGMMPEWLQDVFQFGHPYWAIAAPAEMFMGRLDLGAFPKGVLILVLWILALDRLRVALWARGVRSYSGSGM